MNNNSTHRIYNLPTQKKSHLSRCSNGQVVAYRKGTQIMYGENPLALECREFIDEESAMRALRHIASVDQAQRMGKVCRDCGVPPAEATCAINNGGVHRTETRTMAEIEVVDAESQIARVH